jgi:hypothetical protein
MKINEKGGAREKQSKFPFGVRDYKFFLLFPKQITSSGGFPVTCRRFRDRLSNMTSYLRQQKLTSFLVGGSAAAALYLSTKVILVGLFTPTRCNCNKDDV